MKLVFWVIGASCSGKSYHGKEISDRMGVKLAYLDTAYDRINIDKMSKEDAYKNILQHIEDVAVIEGIIPFNKEEDCRIVEGLLKDYQIIYVLCEPNYIDYLVNIRKRKEEIPESEPVELDMEEYKKYNDGLKEKVKLFYSVKTSKDLREFSGEVVRSLNYQHEGFTNVKYKQLDIDPKDKSVLDLGCSSCQYEKFFMKNGATKYTGLDVNFAYLINKNAHYFDINHLEDWQERADIVVCSSVIHYIHDKETFIKNCSILAKELFVLEIPLSTEQGSKLVLGSRDLFFPTKDLLEEWVSKYFKSFECKGESIVEDGSYRLIYHCKK